MQYRNACRPDLKIIVLTSEFELDSVLNAHLNGVDGYLSKDAGLEEIFMCIIDVCTGGSYIFIPDQF